MLPHAPHAREVVLELRELDLELALGAARVLGEDVEDQLRPVDDARVESASSSCRCCGGAQLVVDEQRLRAATRRTRASAPRACPCRHRCARRAAARRWTISPPARRLPSRESSRNSPSSSSSSTSERQHGDDESPLRLGARERGPAGAVSRRIMTSALSRSGRRPPRAARPGPSARAGRSPRRSGRTNRRARRATEACSSTSSVNDADVWPSGTRDPEVRRRARRRSPRARSRADPRRGGRGGARRPRRSPAGTPRASVSATAAACWTASDMPESRFVFSWR